ncbi:Hepatocyte growth factor-regulated tyrosine kinase substrate [Zea mays]|uniref:Hepatocyte growth factor-regulated tyrosine kinase substrate n=1 Tax=Zea mays TaxID=4577 RepID=A0A3L6ESM7_MAIZE|nr:Hepatocyte growth factor-regulated tyrosine kinase substrate [Zea mays]
MLKGAIFTLGVASIQETGDFFSPFSSPCGCGIPGLAWICSRVRGGHNSVKEAWGREQFAGEMVKAATSDKLKEMDWAKNIEICELVAKVKDVIKSVKKCIGSRSKTTQHFVVMLLEMLLDNCGEPVHRHVIDNGLLPILVKIVKKKTDLPVREKIFLLLDATQTSLGGAKARFPQYYEAYYELVVGIIFAAENFP